LTMLKGVGQVHTVHEVNRSVMEQAIDWLCKLDLNYQGQKNVEAKT
jgi:hypothetical protein